MRYRGRRVPPGGWIHVCPGGISLRGLFCGVMAVGEDNSGQREKEDEKNKPVKQVLLLYVVFLVLSIHKNW
jgi:hypothetical protein